MPPGKYDLHVEAETFQTLVLADFALQANEIVTLEISLVISPAAELPSRLPRLPELGPAPAMGKKANTPM